MSSPAELLLQLDAIRQACSDEDFDRADALLAHYDHSLRALPADGPDARECLQMMQAHQSLLEAQLRGWRQQALDALSEIGQGQRSSSAYRQVIPG